MDEFAITKLEKKIQLLSAIRALPTDNEQCLLVKELAVEYDDADRELTQSLKAQAASLLNEWNVPTGDLV